jgi:hypothetical protein
VRACVRMRVRACVCVLCVCVQEFALGARMLRGCVVVESVTSARVSGWGCRAHTRQLTHTLFPSVSLSHTDTQSISHLLVILLLDGRHELRLERHVLGHWRSHKAREVTRVMHTCVVTHTHTHKARQGKARQVELASVTRVAHAAAHWHACHTRTQQLAHGTAAVAWCCCNRGASRSRRQSCCNLGQHARTHAHAHGGALSLTYEKCALVAARQPKGALLVHIGGVNPALLAAASE